MYPPTASHSKASSTTHSHTINDQNSIDASSLIEQCENKSNESHCLEKNMEEKDDILEKNKEQISCNKLFPIFFSDNYFVCSLCKDYYMIKFYDY